jgi:hypothetical protein
MLMGELKLLYASDDTSVFLYLHILNFLIGCSINKVQFSKEGSIPHFSTPNYRMLGKFGQAKCG